MNELAPSYDLLQYSLLFLAREDGWSENMRLQNNQDGARTRVSMAACYAQRVHFSVELFALHLDGRLFQQYVVDVAAKTEHNTLNFLMLNKLNFVRNSTKGWQIWSNMIFEYILHKWVNKLFSQLHFAVLHVS